jgi:hypothetical protein
LNQLRDAGRLFRGLAVLPFPWESVMTKRRSGFAAFPVAILIAALSHGTPASAEDVASIKAPAVAVNATGRYWTPERFAAARPMPIPIATRGGPATSVTPAGSRPMSSPAVPPEFNGEQRLQLFDANLSGGAEVWTDAVGQDEIEPEAEGTLLAPLHQQSAVDLDHPQEVPVQGGGQAVLHGVGR